MSKAIDNRVLAVALHIIKTNDTIRETAKIFGISKSTIHKDMHDRLIKIDEDLYQQTRKILQDHLNLRHIKGGEATRQLFLKKKTVTL